MSHMVLWLVVAAVMALIEAFSFGLITMWFVVGALVAFVADLLGATSSCRSRCSSWSRCSALFFSVPSS